MQLVLEDGEAQLWGGEAVLMDGVEIGEVRSAAYGHTLGASVALCRLRGRQPLTGDVLQAGRFEVDLAGTKHAARVHLRSPYDPEGRAAQSGRVIWHVKGARRAGLHKLNRWNDSSGRIAPDDNQYPSRPRTSFRGGEAPGHARGGWTTDQTRHTRCDLSTGCSFDPDRVGWSYQASTLFAGIE
ncbi:MAG: hypothetical protein M5U35_10925 [Roseovarius sp.]|nr:hypothetical protein [Roseovarius sp.]